MYLRYLRPFGFCERFYETPGAGGGGGGTPPDPLAAVVKLDQLPDRLKDQISTLVSGRINEEKEKWQRTHNGSIAAEERERLKTLETEAAERKRKDDEAKGNYEAALKSKDDAFDAERKTHKQAIDRVTGRLREKSVDSELVSAAAAERAINPKQIIKLLADHVRLNDEYEVEVLGDDGKPAFKAGKPLTVQELVAQYLGENPHLRQPAGTGGSGSPGGKSVHSEGSAHDDTSPEVQKAIKVLEAAETLARTQPNPKYVTAAHQARRALKKLQDAAAAKT